MALPPSLHFGHASYSSFMYGDGDGDGEGDGEGGGEGEGENEGEGEGEGLVTLYGDIDLMVSTHSLNQ